MNKKLDTIKKALMISENIRDDISFYEDRLEQAISMLFYSTILEYVNDIILLCNNNHFLSVPIILRQLYEAELDLINISNDNEYIDRLILEHCIDQEKLNNALAETGKIDRPTLEKNLSQIKARMLSLKKNGTTELSIFKKFEVAKRTNEYKTVYKILSREAHNALDSLSDRHIINRNEKTYYVTDKTHIEDITKNDSYYKHIYSILNNATRSICKITNYNGAKLELFLKHHENCGKDVLF